MTTHSNFWHWLFLLGTCLVLGCSTAKDDADVSNSQTHWLKACESTDECGALTCSCGVCTRACDDDAACQGATCAETALLDQCEGSAPTAVCFDLSSSGDDDDDVSSDDDPSNGGAPTQPADDDTADDDTADDDDPSVDDDDTAADDDTPSADDDSADDDSPGNPVMDGGSPSGVQCDEYEACSGAGPNPCPECMAAPGCETPICIDAEEWCALSCPNDDCVIAESFPTQPGCSDMIPGNPGPDVVEPEPSCTAAFQLDCGACNCSLCVETDSTCPEDPTAHAGCMCPDPSGVDCAAHPICDPNGGGCEAGNNCMALVGCDLPICIPAAEACAQSCPDPVECEIQESYPEQLACPGRIDAHGDQSVDPDEGVMFACGELTCDSAIQYCDVFVPGVAPSSPSYSCQPLPTECVGAASCACLGHDSAELTGGQLCDETADGAVTVTLLAP